MILFSKLLPGILTHTLLKPIGPVCVEEEAYGLSCPFRNFQWIN